MSTSTPSRTQTRFGTVTRVSPGGAARPSKQQQQQRRVSGANAGTAAKVKSYAELKRAEQAVVEENQQLKALVRKLTDDIEALRGDDRVQELEREKQRLAEWGQQCQTRCSEIEFSAEERHIHDREAFEKQLQEMRDRVEQSDTALDACRDALERHGINAISLEGMSAPIEGDDGDDDATVISDGILDDLAASETMAERILAELTLMSRADAPPSRSRTPSPSSSIGAADVFFSPLRSVS
ncbi:unnamed protein product (mitochondrion) [Plasmodiophora brassicae]|uniref:Uncharacterized protein n=1 Tax=Plasmodiophora brassicae TaxID=37360 RepID=A0A0G4IW76_PLABS|nr:hypothetical protein PBRA_007288 [Plasmodiophora brassicae]SPQ95948.1 unnamed protein product [Plasmodiophora brassicae]